MDDAMLDLTADQGGLRRRLEAYADARLSPDLSATTRMRSRVLAVAHRQSALTRSDVTLALVADPLGQPVPSPRDAARSWRSRPVMRRTATLFLAATLALVSVSGIAFAARPGGGLYGAVVWAETLTLPSDPRLRVVAELERLDQRLAEIAGASVSGDAGAAQAALLEYQRIVDQITAYVDAADDPVAEVALQEGVGNNVAILSGLVDRLPAGASDAVERAIERAIERSTEAIESIKPGNGNGGGGGNEGGNGGGAGDPGGPAATGRPAATEAPVPTATPKPTKTPKPEATPKPTRTPRPEATPRPDRTPAPSPGPGSDGSGASEAGGGPEDQGPASSRKPASPGPGD